MMSHTKKSQLLISHRYVMSLAVPSSPYSMEIICTCKVASSPDYFFPHIGLQLEQSALLEHLINSLHNLETSGIVIQTGNYC